MAQLQQRLHLVREREVEQVAGRDVGCHREVEGACLHPGARLRQRAVEHVQGVGADQAGLLGQRDERVRVEEAALGMLPAHECLDAEHATRLQVGLGLEVQDELFVVDAASQLGDQIQALACGAIKEGVKACLAACNASPACTSSVSGSSPCSGRRDPDARPDHFAHAVGRLDRRVRPADIGDQDRE